MDRVAKVTLFLKYADRATVLDQLRVDHPEATGRHEHVIRWTPWILERQRRVALVLAVVALVVAALLFGGWRLSRPRLPVIEAFAPGLPGIVVVGPWLLEGKNKKLCDDIEARTPPGARAIRCLPFPATASADALRESAREAGARLVAVITATGVARVWPLGRLEKDPLFGSVLVMNLEREAHRELAPFLWNALAFLGTPEPDFALDLPCPPVGSRPLDQVALLTLLVVPACESVKLEALQFTGVCGTHTPDSDETCALARYLRAEAEPDLARSLLTQLRDQGPSRFRAVATLKVARLDCKDRRFAEAARAVVELSSSGEPCVRAKLAEVAACLGAHEAGADGAALRALADLDIGGPDLRECAETIRADALAGRAQVRGQAGRWAEASADYRRAYELYPDPMYRLAEAESLLQRRPGEAALAREARVGEARRILDRRPRRGDDRALLVYGALLDWIASRAQADRSRERDAAREMVSLHAGVRPGEAAMSWETDAELRALACDGARVPCVYEVLRRASSPEELTRSLGDP
jgi:hypothetical protein